MDGIIRVDRDGAQAFADGFEFNENPFSPGTPEHFAWALAWTTSASTAAGG